MKNRLLLTFLCGAMSAGLMAQSIKDEVKITGDLTSKIQNANFSQGTPVATLVNTYDYNMPDNGAGAGGTGLFGMQAVTGWTASVPSDNIKVMENANSENRTDGANAKAAGLFAYASEDSETAGPGLGGADYHAPYADTESEGNTLGYVAVWGANLSYTQDITLPAGDYLMEVKLVNTAGSGVMNKNNVGFIAADGTEYLSTTTTYSVSTTTRQYDYVVFRLTKETAGKLSLGYQAGNFGSDTAPHVFVENVKLYSVDPSYLDAQEIAAAKAELEALVEKGQQLGLDTSESQAVLNNPNATLEQIKAAIEKQKAANEAAQTDMSIYFLKNAHFTADTPLPDDNGITTYDYDMVDPNGANQRVVDYYGMQPVVNWTANRPGENSFASGVFSVGSNSFLGGAAYLPPLQMSDGSTEGNLLGLVTCWSATCQYTQKVTLPAGTYTLTMSYYNSGGAQAVAKNLIGFIADDGNEYLGETLQFPVGKWTQDNVTFTLDEATSGYFTLGYTATNTGSGNMPHFFIDGISISFVGELENPSLIILTAATNSAEEVINEKFNKDIKDKLQEAINAANALISAESTDEDANIAAYNKINEVMEEVNASVAAYEKLKDFIDGDLANAKEKYADASIYAGLADQLLDFDDDLNEAYQSETYTTEQIEEAISSLNAMIKEGVQKAWDAAVESGKELAGDGIDISMFFDQLAYTYSTTAQSGANVPDKEWKYGDATNFKTQYGTAEVWNQTPFTVSRTISGLPAGTYTVTTKAFYRVADNVTNYDSYQDYDGKAYVFAGTNKTALANVAEIAASVAPEGLGWAEVAASSTVYHPNSQQAAYNTFESAEYAEVLQKSAKSVVVNDNGELTFGVTADQLEENAWVVWYTFSISYNAVSADVLSEELQALIDEANDYLETYQDDMNALASGSLESAIGDASEVVDGEIEEMSEALVALKAAFDYAKANVAALVTLQDAIDALEAAFSEYSGTASQEAMDEYDVVTGLADDTDDLTNEEIEALTERALAAVKWLKVPASGDASDDNPVDMTQVIDNADFEQNGENGVAVPGWSYTASGVDTNAPKNKNDAINGKSAEFWGGTPANIKFNIYQTLSGLPAGTYELKAMAVSAQVDTDAEGYVALYAQTANGVTSSKKVDVRANTGENGAYGAESEIFEDAKEYSVIFTLTEDKEEVTVGFMSVDTLSTRWFICDDFTLTYYGQNSSKEVTPDEGDIVVIDGINAAATEVEAIYTVAGAKVATLQKGINIVKYANGKVAKVLVK